MTEGTYWAWPPTTSPDVRDMERDAKRADMLRDKSKMPPQMPDDRPGIAERVKGLARRLAGR